jgi:hypothetical protein
VSTVGNTTLNWALSPFVSAEAITRFEIQVAEAGDVVDSGDNNDTANDIELESGDADPMVAGNFNGIIKSEGYDGTITVLATANFTGNIEVKDHLAAIVVTVGPGKLFIGNIKNEGNGNVTVIIQAGDGFIGNIENKGDGIVSVTGAGSLIGNVKNEGSGACAVTVGSHNGNEEGNCT